MQCSYCSGHTRVIDTATATSLSRIYLSEAVKNIDHIDEDMRIRRRQCKLCNKRSYTVEISLQEIQFLYRIAEEKTGKDELKKMFEERKDYVRERRRRKRS